MTKSLLIGSIAILVSTFAAPARADEPAVTPSPDASAPLAPDASAAAPAPRVVRVHFRKRDGVRYPEALLSVRGADAAYTALCLAPCDPEVPAGSTLRVTVPNADDTEVVLAEKDGSEVYVFADRVSTLKNFGAALIVFGVVLMPVGLLVGIGSGLGGGRSSPSPAAVVLTTGAIMMGAGVVLAIAMPRQARAEVRRTVVVPAAPVVRTSGLLSDVPEHASAPPEIARSPVLPLSFGFRF